MATFHIKYLIPAIVLSIHCPFVFADSNSNSTSSNTTANTWWQSTQQATTQALAACNQMPKKDPGIINEKFTEDGPSRLKIGDQND